MSFTRQSIGLHHSQWKLYFLSHWSLRNIIKNGNIIIFETERERLARSARYVKREFIIGRCINKRVKQEKHDAPSMGMQNITFTLLYIFFAWICPQLLALIWGTIPPKHQTHINPDASFAFNTRTKMPHISSISTLSPTYFEFETHGWV